MPSSGSTGSFHLLVRTGTSEIYRSRRRAHTVSYIARRRLRGASRVVPASRSVSSSNAYYPLRVVIEGSVPEGRFGRFARFAKMGGAVATVKLFTRDPEKVAEQMAEALGNLRGLAAKVGQMASYVD